MDKAFLKSIPCKNQESFPSLKACCKLFDGLFDVANAQRIMALMKYSLEYSHQQHTYLVDEYLNMESRLGGNKTAEDIM